MSAAAVIAGTARWHVEHSDCLVALRAMPDHCVDAIVTDPPAGIAFMNMEFDSDRGGRDAWGEWLTAIMREALRVLKPGGHALVWALPRTSHWTATAVENAGFQIRDIVSHIFASGFPKSHNVSKAIDRANGDVRPITGTHTRPAKSIYGDPKQPEVALTSAASAASAAWDGWGTALKPAREDWVLARKPLDGTIAQNVLRHRTGALNIDATRIAGGMDEFYSATGKPRSGKCANGNNGILGMGDGFGGDAANPPSALGRWPAHLALSHDERCERVGTKRIATGTAHRANSGGQTFGSSALKPPLPDMTYADADGLEEVAEWSCVDGCPVKLLDEQSGDRPGMSGGGEHSESYQGGMFGAIDSPGTARGDSGGASRFFATFHPEDRQWEPHGGESTQDASTSVGKNTESSGADSRIDGCGSSTTDQLPTDTKSITRTEIHSITPSTISSASVQRSTTDYTHQSGRTMSSSTEQSAGDVSPVMSTSRSTSSIEEQPARIKAIASSAPADDSMRGAGPISGNAPPTYATGGSAVRFMFTSKPSTSEREAGLDWLATETVNDGREKTNDTAYQRGATKRRNVHPTVKAQSLMRWLCRMITPPNGIVLDPFAGSGSTIVAALAENFRAIGIEQSAEYVRIARARIIGDAPLLNRQIGDHTK